MSTPSVTAEDLLTSMVNKYCFLSIQGSEDSEEEEENLVLVSSNSSNKVKEKEENKDKDKYLTCHLCSEVGHLTSNCPNRQKIKCNYCLRTGHKEWKVFSSPRELS